MSVDTNDPTYQKAVSKARKIRNFYEHLASFVLINIILIVINLLTSPDSLWFYWITFFWGIALVWHATRTFLMPFDDWEEKKVQQYMEEEKKKQE